MLVLLVAIGSPSCLSATDATWSISDFVNIGAAKRITRRKVSMGKTCCPQPTTGAAFPQIPAKRCPRSGRGRAAHGGLPITSPIADLPDVSSPRRKSIVPPLFGNVWSAPHVLFRPGGRCCAATVRSKPNSISALLMLALVKYALAQSEQ
jgi:hypothetical protein